MLEDFSFRFRYSYDLDGCIGLVIFKEIYGPMRLEYLRNFIAIF